MKRVSTKPANDELRSEYDLSRLKGAARGKYHARMKAGTNLVLIDAEVAEAFPTEESVNRALKLLLATARAATDAPPRKRPRSSAKAG